MKNVKFVLATWFLGSLAVSLTTCAGPLALNGILVMPANPSIPVGVTQQFTATGYYNDQTNQDITAEVTWSSSNTAVATVNSSGLATAAGEDTATVTATSGSIWGSATLTVTPA